MTINEWLKFAEAYLNENGIRTARLDSLLLLENVTGHDRAWLLANPGSSISPRDEKKLKNLLKERSNHVPISYLLGKTEFYGRVFVLNESVLEPRPESETMIDILKDIASSIKNGLGGSHKNIENIRIADVGAGSGALGITAALEIPNSVVELLDIDKKALKTAKINVDLFTLNLSLKCSDLLKDAGETYDILLCNLPYFPDGFKINLAATHEPRIAIFGGKDGLDVYRRLFDQLKVMQNRPLYILCESLPFQHEELEQIAKDSFYKLEKSEDFIQAFKLRS